VAKKGGCFSIDGDESQEEQKIKNLPSLADLEGLL
jgi:hypothetical protein